MHRHCSQLFPFHRRPPGFLRRSTFSGPQSLEFWQIFYKICRMRSNSRRYPLCSPVSCRVARLSQRQLRDESFPLSRPSGESFQHVPRRVVLYSLSIHSLRYIPYPRTDVSTVKLVLKNRVSFSTTRCISSHAKLPSVHETTHNYRFLQRAGINSMLRKFEADVQDLGLSLSIKNICEKFMHKNPISTCSYCSGNLGKIHKRK